MKPICTAICGVAAAALLVSTPFLASSSVPGRASSLAAARAMTRVPGARENMPSERPASQQNTPPATAPSPAKAPPRNTQPGQTPGPTPSTDILAPLITQAQAALDRKDYETAIGLLQKIIAQRPDDALPHFELGYAYSELKRNAEAAAEYRRAIALNKGLVAAHLNLGLILMDSDPNAAAESFRFAAALVPDQGRPHFLAGQALERAGKVADAVAEYNAALAITPRDQGIKFALARALLAVGRAAEAESQFRETIALDAAPAAGAGAASGARDAGGVGGMTARAASGAPEGTPGSARGAATAFTMPAKLGLAETLLREHKTAEAVDAFSVYLQVAPGDRVARFERSVALQELGRLDDALAELDRTDQDATPSADSVKLRGSIDMQKRDWGAASSVLQTALAAAPNDPDLHAWQGHTQMELHNYAAAETELKRSLALDPKPTDVLGDLVNVYYLSGNYTQALAAIDVLAKRQPLTAINWFFRAICYDKLRQISDAAAAYQKFLDLDQGSHADQEFQARQRIKILERELKR